MVGMLCVLMACIAAEPSEEKHLFYLHGAIVEREGPNAVSLRFGPYQFAEIVERLETEGFVVEAPLRDVETDVERAAALVAADIRDLIDLGTPADHVVLVGASRGAYIATLAAAELREQELNLVLLAGCTRPVVDAVVSAGRLPHGHLLAIRESGDLLADSCDRLAAASPGVTSYDEVVTELGVGHGLVYRPYDEWVAPLLRHAER